MRYFALACDYDGTLASHGKVSAETSAALRRVAASGRKLLLVTGRDLPDLLRVFDEAEIFDFIVAENGAVLYRPASRQLTTLGKRPPVAFIDALRQRQVEPLSIGEVIVATWAPHEVAVLEAIREHGLEHQVIFNKGAVMILPPGVNKGTGLGTALRRLALSAHNVVGVGDAENDHAFLNLCECAVAVANALPTVKEETDLVTLAPNGPGTVELINLLLDDDLSSVESALARHDILLGTRHDGQEVRLHPYGSNVLLVGPAGAGKSRLIVSFLERLGEQGYQFCLLDPEGDFEGYEDAITLGTSERVPTVDEVLEVLKMAEDNAVVRLTGAAFSDRPRFFGVLLARLQELRARSGRPHWIVADEAHHLLPATYAPDELAVPRHLTSTLFATVHPANIAPAALSLVDVVIAVGERPEQKVGAFVSALGEQPPEGLPTRLEQGEALIWDRRTNTGPVRFRVAPGRELHRRHRQKYAEGALGPDKSFCFRGPEGKLRLRAQNLDVFMQLADGVDDETWLYHLRRGDYSSWFRSAIKDPGLADAAEEAERVARDSADRSRALIKEAIRRRYTAPVNPLRDTG